MPIKTKSLKGTTKKQATANDPEEKAAKGAEPAKLGAARRLAITKLVNAKLSTAKLVTLRKFGGS